MITLFIIRSCADPKDPKKTIESFFEVVDDLWLLNSIDDVNAKEKKNEWYGVMYDNEIIDEPLNEGLKVFIEQCDADVLILMAKVGDKIYKSPRLFRRNVLLNKGSLMPEGKDLKFETVLNGWVLQNDIG